MNAFTQTTIHSKIAKRQNIQGQNTFGKLYRGTLIRFGKSNENFIIPTKKEEVQTMVEANTTFRTKMKNKILSSLNKKDDIILMQSSIFPAIYFKKTTMRNVLKEFNFPKNVKALAPDDDRLALIFQIVGNLFSEITFFLFNVMIGNDIQSQSYFVFFSDSQTIPFTKCCNTPAYIQLNNNSSGKILCNSLKCPHSNLAEFIINFEDAIKLWNNITYLQQTTENDSKMKKYISKIITNGKHTKVHLSNIIHETSKHLVEVFYQKKNQQYQLKGQDKKLGEYQNEFSEGPFITKSVERSLPNVLQPVKKSKKDILIMTADDILNSEEQDVDIIKMKIDYMNKNHGRNISKQISKKLSNEGKVFHQNFQIIKKIDEYMDVSKNKKTTTKISFPKIMDKMVKNVNKTLKSHSMYNVLS